MNKIPVGVYPPPFVGECVYPIGGYLRPDGYVTVSEKTDGGIINRPAHRVAYEKAHGKIPEGLVIDHLCRQTNCVNVDHLETVTSKVNVLRGMSPTALNARKAGCPYGHGDYDHVRPDGHRACSACAIAQSKMRNALNKEVRISGGPDYEVLKKKRSAYQKTYRAKKKGLV